MKIPTQYATDDLIDVALVCEDGKVIETHKAMRAPCSARGEIGGQMRQARGARGKALLY